MADELRWRKSSFSPAGSDCVELAADGAVIAVRNSKRPGAGTLRVSRPALAGLLAAARAGDLDDLTT